MVSGVPWCDWCEEGGHPGCEVDVAGKPPHFPLETQTLVVKTFSNQVRGGKRNLLKTELDKLVATSLKSVQLISLPEGNLNTAFPVL